MMPLRAAQVRVYAESTCELGANECCWLMLLCVRVRLFSCLSCRPLLFPFLSSDLFFVKSKQRKLTFVMAPRLVSFMMLFLLGSSILLHVAASPLIAATESSPVSTYLPATSSPTHSTNPHSSTSTAPPSTPLSTSSAVPPSTTAPPPPQTSAAPNPIPDAIGFVSEFLCSYNKTYSVPLTW
jgi:hypothetical protein